MPSVTFSPTIMAVSEHRFENWNDALNFLRHKATSGPDHVFRGHTTPAHRLQTSWSRYTRTPHEGWMSNIHQVLTAFQVGLINNGLAPFETGNIQDWLEYGRHHGVPTPCLDFTYSPYVALCFALSNLNGASTPDNDAVVYVLDTARLASAWAHHRCQLPAQRIRYAEFYREFLNPPNDFFARGFPPGIVQFFPFPSKTNIRMQRQQGALLYETLNYRAQQVQDLEAFLEAKIDDARLNAADGSAQERRVLYKVFLRADWRESILSELELVGMGGGYLYGTADGVAQDVKNTYFYTSRRGYLRDVTYQPPTL